MKTAFNKCASPARMDADFEGGSIENIRGIKANHFGCSLRKGTAPAPLWYYFRLRGVKNRRISIEIDNAYDIKNDKSCLDYPENWPVARPVFSYDRKHYERIRNTHYDHVSGVFSFSHRFEKDTVYVSYSLPYVYSNLEKYLKRIRTSPYVRIRQIARSYEGRKVYSIAVTDRRFRGDKKGVWIFARQHAGETPGSFAMEGLTDSLLSDASPAKRLREEFEFNLVPMIDVDNVFHGNYGKDGPPVDYNRDWKIDSRRPIVKAIKKTIGQWARRHQFNLFMDFHAPGLAHGNDMGTLPAALSSDELRKYNMFSALLADRSPKCNPYVCRRYQGQEHVPAAGFAHAWFHGKYGVFAVLLEISYHRAVKGRNLYVTPDSIRAYGAAIARTIYALRKNFVLAKQKEIL